MTIAARKTWALLPMVVIVCAVLVTHAVGHLLDQAMDWLDRWVEGGQA